VSITARAEAIADLLRSDEVRASTDIRDTVPPCLLVVPVPRLNFLEGTLSGSTEVTWTIVALAMPPGDLEAARELENLVLHVVAAGLDVTTAEPASYELPTTEGSVPAYLITVSETAALEE
jgi:hypothetical protein